MHLTLCENVESGLCAKTSKGVGRQFCLRVPPFTYLSSSPFLHPNSLFENRQRGLFQTGHHPLPPTSQESNQVD
ncbi:MAG: hypothetical protein BYD32DRAFT_426823 [Podila humilis]|nr:MAG: hypothetical protein BYD32DRAFT_426823 [Podila humilis]